MTNDELMARLDCRRAVYFWPWLAGWLANQPDRGAISIATVLVIYEKGRDPKTPGNGDAIGQHFWITGEVKRPWWRRFLDFMGAP